VSASAETTSSTGSSSTSRTGGTTSGTSSGGTYGTPSVNEAFGNLNRTVNEIFADRAREREARRQAREAADDSSSNVSYADREADRRYDAARAAEAERAARDRDLTERLENERRLESANEAIEAEMNRLAKNDAIEAEMRREEFAPIVDEIVVSAAKDETPVPGGDARFNEIAPERGAFREAFYALSERVPSEVQAFRDTLPVMVPDKMAEYGLGSAYAAREEALGDALNDAAPAAGGTISDRIFGWAVDKAFDNAYEHLKQEYVTAVQSQSGADPSDALDRNVTATAVEVHPLSGFLPRLIRSGMNVPRALYEQGKGYIDAGMKNLGLAVDSFDPKEDR
jgi:hypothetical protein